MNTNMRLFRALKRWQQENYPDRPISEIRLRLQSGESVVLPMASILALAEPPDRPRPPREDRRKQKQEQQP